MTARSIWAKTYLKNYGAIESSKRGSWSLTEKGRTLQTVDRKEVKQAVQQVYTRANKSKTTNAVDPRSTQPSIFPKPSEIQPSDDLSVDAPIPVESDFRAFTICCRQEKPMPLTAEMRWFYRGNLPQEISHWFQQDELGEHLAPPEEREDVYLYLAECDYLGIKLRQGRLEIKWRKAELGVVSFGDRVEGKAEKWGKWLCEDPTKESFQPAGVAGKKEWVGVKKVRPVRQYQVLPEASITAVPVNESIDQGCTVELTELSINGNVWWSLAFEAFGEDDCLMHNLEAVASFVFKTYRGPKLQAGNSYAYPSWLCLVVRNHSNRS